MNAQEAVKKYGVWVAGGAIVLYLVYRQTQGGASRQSLIGPAPPGAAGISSDQYRLESERLRQAGAFDLERLKIQAAEEAARRKADLDRYNLEQQLLAQKRALDAAQRGQTLGLIGSLAKSISDLFKGSQSPKPASPGGPGTMGPNGPISSGRQFPGTPPYYPIPSPVIDVFGPYTPSYPSPPEYIPLRIDDWGEAPQFQTSGLDLDTGATFYDMWAGGDFNYGYGQGFSDPYSSFPELTSGYDPYSKGGNIGIDDFYYGYSADWGDSGYSVDSGGDSGYTDIGAGGDFNYGGMGW